MKRCFLVILLFFSGSLYGGIQTWTLTISETDVTQSPAKTYEITATFQWDDVYDRYKIYPLSNGSYGGGGLNLSGNLGATWGGDVYQSNSWSNASTIDSFRIWKQTHLGTKYEQVINFREPPDPCGPIEFEKTYENTTSVTEYYRVYIGSELMDTFSIGPYRSHDFYFYSDEECDSLRIIKEVDRAPAIEMDEVPPQSPDPVTDPQEPPLEDPPEHPDFEDTDVGAAAGSGNVDDQGNEKSDVEKEVEAQWLLWKGVDERLEGIGNGIGDVEEGLEDIEGGIGDVEEGIVELVEGQEEGLGLLETIKDILFGWNDDIEDGKSENFENHASSQNGYAAQMVGNVPVPQVQVASQSYNTANGGWPVVDLPILGSIDTNPYTRFPVITQYGGICRTVILVIVWLVFLRKIGNDCKDYIIGAMSTPATNVNTGGENIAFPVHLAKALAKSAAIIVAITALATGVFVLMEAQSATGGLTSVQTAFGVDISSSLATLGPFPALINTFLPVPEFLTFFMLGTAFPLLCMPLFLLAGFIVRLIPV